MAARILRLRAVFGQRHGWRNYVPASTYQE